MRIRCYWQRENPINTALPLNLVQAAKQLRDGMIALCEVSKVKISNYSR